jgi:hypothetical protein
MLDHLSQFHTLPANVTIKEHYIAADAKPRKSSIAGKRRVECKSYSFKACETILIAYPDI